MKAVTLLFIKNMYIAHVCIHKKSMINVLGYFCVRFYNFFLFIMSNFLIITMYYFFIATFRKLIILKKLLFLKYLATLGLSCSV